MERVVVTGAGGFIGGYVVKKLIDEGYFVVAIDRGETIRSKTNVQNVISDLSSCTDVELLAKTVGEVSVFVHLAADITVPGDEKTVENNTESMVAAIKLAEKVRAKHFVFLSSIPVIGEIRQTPILENHPVNPKTPYHWSKLFGERILESGLSSIRSYTIVRIPSPIGIGMRSNVFVSVIIRKMLANETVEVFGNGERIQSYIDVRDLAEAIRQIVEKRPQGLFLIAGIPGISNREMVELCKKITGSKTEIICGLHEDKEEYQKWIVSCKKANDTFGFSPKYSAEETLRWIVEGLI